jgi:hypothetical protein
MAIKLDLNYRFNSIVNKNHFSVQTFISNFYLGYNRQDTLNKYSNIM